MEYDSGQLSNHDSLSRQEEPTPRAISIRKGVIPLISGVILIVMVSIFALVGSIFVVFDNDAKARYTENAEATITYVSERSYTDSDCTGSGSSRSCTTDTLYACTFSYEFRAGIDTLVEKNQESGYHSQNRCANQFPQASFTGEVYYDSANPESFTDMNPQESSLGIVGVILLVISVPVIIAGFVLVITGIVKLILSRKSKIISSEI